MKKISCRHTWLPRLSLLFLSGLMIIFYGCKKETPVQQIVQPSPKLVTSADTLIFNDDESKILMLTTNPSTQCEYHILSQPGWIEIHPSSGTINNSISNLSVSAIFTGFASGIYDDNIVIMSTLGNKTVHVRGVVGEQTLFSIPDSLIISPFSDQKSFSIINQGNVPLHFIATCSNSFITLPSGSGDINKDAQADVIVNVNRSSMLNGINEAKIFLNINGMADTIMVSIENIQEKKIIITSDVIDAEYSRLTNSIIYVSGDPMKVTIYNVISKTSSDILLPYMPTCVSVTANGHFAAVGHDGHASYIDLVNKTVLKTIDIPCEAADIVLANNNWAYVAPAEDQWVHLQSIDFTNDNVVQSTYSIYENNKLKMHPSGKYIYIAESISSSGLIKMDIRNGAAVYLYESPWGENPSGGDLWFSEDGVRIFTQPKNVFKTSELQSQDMMYNGKILFDGNTYDSHNIKWLDHSGNKNNLYVIFSGGGWDNEPNLPYIYVYNATNLVFKSKTELEKYLVPDGIGGGTLYDAEPYFAFCNTVGDKVFVLTKAVGSGLLHEWAIQEINIQ